MKRIIQIGIIFIKNSKRLTFSAFLSIFVACFLSISMFQLLSDVEASIEAGLAAKKGDFDLQVTKCDGEIFNNEEIRFLEHEKGVKTASRGYCTGEFSDIYMAGVADDAVNKSLYKYTKDIKKNSIIINESLGRRENKTVGDSFSVCGKDFQIIEVVKTDFMSDYKMPMVIMELSQLHQLLGHKDTRQVNYILLQCYDSAYTEQGNDLGLSRRIRLQNINFQVSDQRAGDGYDIMLKNTRLVFKVFFVVVIMVSGLFVVNIFMEYMQKYRADMAVIRTMGGKQEQVQAIFDSMSVIISAGGCLTGAMFSALVSDVVLNWFNDKVQLFDGSISLNWKVLWQITVIVFVLFNFFIHVVSRSCQKVLPIQVFKETSSGLRKSKKASRFLALRKVTGMEGYLGIKLMVLKFRQNLMIILIIALITALSYTGQVSIKLLKANDNWFNYNSMEGKTARGEISVSKPMSLSYVQKLYKRFQPVMGSGYMLYGDFSMVLSDDDETINYFKVSDLEVLLHLLYTEIWEQYEEVPKTKRIVMEESVAGKNGYKLGDTITLESDYLGGKKDFILVEIVKSETVWNETYNVIVDWDNLCEKECHKEDLSGNYLGVWLDGDKEFAREKFQQLQVEMGKDFEWNIYDDIMEQSNLKVSQWTTTMHIVLGMLLIVASIGLLNSAGGMLYTRRKEYQIIHMLGASDNSVRKICWMQTWSYMVSGVVLGAILGIIIVAYLWQANMAGNIPVIINWEYIAWIAIYLFVLSLMLYPTIKKMG